jgi:bifunctional N-acetylglucosamine-1-phosphate-uridyltransferase/glucosamine-1-phosphate-acetyltransferase GlmU-like protein
MLQRLCLLTRWPFNSNPKEQATLCGRALPMLEGFQGRVLVLYGDVPLTRPDTLGHLLAHHDQGDGFGATFLAMAPP